MLVKKVIRNVENFPTNIICLMCFLSSRKIVFIGKNLFYIENGGFLDASEMEVP